MLYQVIPKFDTSRALKFVLVVFVILSLMLSWFYMPQAEAVAGAAALIAGAAVSSEVIGSVIATIILAATGVCFENGFFGDTDNLSTAAYEVGYHLVQDMMLTGGNVASWLDEAIEIYSLTGGFAQGDDIEVPAEVLEYARAWAVNTYDFSGEVTFSDGCIFNENGDCIILSDSATYDNNATTFAGAESADGSDIAYHTIGDLQFAYYYTIGANDSETHPYRYDYYIVGNIGSSHNISTSFVNLATSYGRAVTVEDCVIKCNNVIFLQNSNNTKIYLNVYNVSTGESYQISRYLNADDIISSANSSITATDAIAVPQTEDKTLYIPSSVDMGTIGEYTVPAIQALTSEMVLDGPITDTETDEPITPDVDIPVDDSFTVPDTWSGFDAWLKTQAKTFTDFTSLVQQKITGIATDVADFGTSIKEWINEKWGTFTDSISEHFLGIQDFMNDVALLIDDIVFGIADFIVQIFGPEGIVTSFIIKIMDWITGKAFEFASVWHYVTSWIGSLSPWLSLMFSIWGGLPYQMVVPVYATAVIVIVLTIFKRFFQG